MGNILKKSFKGFHFLVKIYKLFKTCFLRILLRILLNYSYLSLYFQNLGTLFSVTSIALRKKHHNTSLCCSSSIFSLNQFIYSSSYKINSSILIILIKYKWKDSSKNSNYNTYYKCIEILHSGWWKKFGDIHADADVSSWHSMLFSYWFWLPLNRFK